ncbi:MAG: hypothetical protein ACK5MK_08310 [Dysgonomonas sp.]
MKKLLLLLILGVLSVYAYSQEITDSTLVLGSMKSFDRIGKGVDSYTYSSICTLEDTKYLDADTYVIVSGIYECKDNKYYKVIYKNEEYYVEKANLDLQDPLSYFYISNFSQDSKEKFHKHAKELGAVYHYYKLKKILDFTESCKAKGLVILDWGIYDESEYTSGTSVKFSFHNPTKKTIKYIWVNLVGYNPVGDKVIERGKSLKTVRCIGPIESDSGGSYSFDYVWFSDLVEDAKIMSIKVQYMDGTIKTITNAKLVRLDRDLYNYISED